MTGTSTRVLRRCALPVSIALLSACGDGTGGPSSPSRTPSATTAPGPDRVSRWRADIDQLARELPERHVDPFTKVSRETFTSKAQALRNDVPDLDDPAVVVGLMELVALIGDSHTSLDTRSYDGFRQLPLAFEWLEDGIYLTRASEPFRHAVGARLARVGDASVEAVIEALSPLAAYENESWRRVLVVGLLVIPEILQARGIVADASEVTLELAGPDGAEIELDVPAQARGAVDFGPTSEPIPLYRQQPERSYWLTYLEDSGVLYAVYRRAADMPSEPVSSFAARLLEILDGEPARTLVLDLRENQGGNSSLLEPLIAGLEQRPRWSGGEGIYVVIGRRTFSSGMINAFDLNQRLGATLVGEPTGGKPNHFGEVRTFRLTESTLPVSYSTRFFRLVEGADPPSLEPDVSTPVASDDFFAGRDPALETILDLAGR